MPMQALQCVNGHASEIYLHHTSDEGTATRLCRCGNTLAPTLSVGRALTFFEEGRPFVMRHGVPRPITITSHEQHKKVMKQYNLELATDWHTSKKQSTR